MIYTSYGKERCIILANYLVENRTTVRKVAQHFGISKSTVHKDITTNLKRINTELYYKAKEILDINRNERHIRGGEATRQKYRKNKPAQDE